jgi:hypothetical protein
MGKESTVRVVWDSGASISIPPSKDDFVGEFNPVPFSVTLHDQAKGSQLQEKGVWAIVDPKEQLRMLKVPAYYVPAFGIHILSTPSSQLYNYEDETINMQANQLILSGVSGDSTRGSIIAPVDPMKNLPTSQAYCYDGSQIMTDSYDVWLLRSLVS